MNLICFVVLLFGSALGAVYSSTQNRNLCLGGVEITNLNHKQRAFNSGECSPVVLVPGFLATSLVVQIDCEDLRQSSPEIFTACGWTTCNRSLLASGTAPKSEYRLWIGEPLTKFFPVQGNLDKCLGDFLKFADGKDSYQEPKGIKITWYGDTPQTKQQRSCGANAIRDLSGKINTLRHCALDGFAKTIDMLENLGYVSGVNFQAVPYDFRFSAKSSEASEIIVRSIKELTRNTGKKVILVGHSFGSIHILKALTKLTLGEKSERIGEYISIGAPFLGSAKAVKQAIAWDESLVKRILNIELGFGCYSQQMLALSSGSIVNFLPRSSLQEFTGQPWIKRLSVSPPKWLPTYTNFSFNQLAEYLKKPQIINIAGQDFSGDLEDFRRLFNERNNSRILRSLQQGFDNDPKLFHLNAPDVPTTVIFSARYPTESKYSFPECDSVADCAKLPNITEYLAGDETVTVISAVLPALKWIAQGNRGSVKLVEYGGSPIPINPHYSVLNSSCANLEDIHCRHPCMHQDDTVVSHIFDRLIRSERIGRGVITHIHCASLAQLTN